MTDNFNARDVIQADKNNVWHHLTPHRAMGNTDPMVIVSGEGMRVHDAKGNEYLTFAPWISLFPGLFLFLTMIAFNLLGDGVRDHLDPRGGSVV